MVQRKAYAPHLSGAPPRVVQSKFDLDGAWMQSVDDTTLLAKFGATTAALWSALREHKADIGISSGGSGGGWNFSTMMLEISSSWFNPIKEYVTNGTKGTQLGRGIAALTHEMSHAHDQIVRKESPRGASKDTDAFVIAVLKTELRAWMKEARCARENYKDKSIPPGDDNNNLIKGWLGVHFSLKDAKNVLKADVYENPVVGRLHKYFNDNKSTKTTSTLADLLTTSSTGLAADLTSYAQQIRDKFTSDDTMLRSVASGAISTS
ncbi:hypothetical protein [Polyangium sp. 6x1]|uniref:hypothetical protein n=1 Tax=Polyangium sp. 6x1 TaxID=3042689 RepID=UPI00248272D5|nr:hypothetical protein [Polyangium sp. 6x1]MDI1444131.1 hypothetical protein [Polyangium sp. 6x1]